MLFPDFQNIPVSIMELQYLIYYLLTYFLQANKKFGKKLMHGTETVNIMVGQAEFLDSPVVFVTRLQKSCVLGDLSEVNAPTRFLCVCVGPSSSATMAEYEETGRALGALFTDKVR